MSAFLGYVELDRGIPAYVRAEWPCTLVPLQAKRAKHVWAALRRTAGELFDKVDQLRGAEGGKAPAYWASRVSTTDSEPTNFTLSRAFAAKDGHFRRTATRHFACDLHFDALGVRAAFSTRPGGLRVA